MARSFHTSTGTGAPAPLLIPGASDFLALFASSVETGAFYVKLWWSGNNTAPPVVGTTIPTLTIPVPANGQAVSLNFPLNNGGNLYMWATKNGGDTDTTALTAGGDALTVVFD
jgi:hypothetical protein